jgi:AcrR family transcriptional regulator
MSTQSRPYRLKARAEQQEVTRRRIIEATAALHDEVGPARTTVVEIARRAGVQRLTVYNNFPDERTLFEACGAHWMSLHPLPDMSSALAEEDAAERLRLILAGLYGWYRATERSNEHMQRDRLVMPALDAVMRIRMDRQMTALADLLASGFQAAHDPVRVRATAALALDFWTWRRLSHEGMTDTAAALVMVDLVKAAAGLLAQVSK